MENKNWDWKKLRKEIGIKVQIPNDIDKDTGKQKYRPAIVIKSYPSHVKVQLMTTESSNHDYFKIKINNQIQYIRPIYYRTIPLEWINRIWRDNRWWSFEALLKADANVNIQNKDGETPLHFAAKSSHDTHSKWNKYQLFYDLLNHGANVNIKNKNGKTAIDLCQNTNLKLILQNAQKVQEPWEEIDFKSFENLDLQNQPSTSKSQKM